MATLREAIKTALEDDATLGTLLTGGVYDRRGISRTLTPDAFDSNGALQPCAVVTLEVAAPEITGHREWRFERVYFLVWLYEDEGGGYATLDPAALRVRSLLHNQTLATDDGAVHHIEHVGSLGDSYDDTLLAEMTYERFVAFRQRDLGIAT